MTDNRSVDDVLTEWGEHPLNEAAAISVPEVEKFRTNWKKMLDALPKKMEKALSKALDGAKVSLSPAMVEGQATNNPHGQISFWASAAGDGVAEKVGKLAEEGRAYTYLIWNIKPQGNTVRFVLSLSLYYSP